MRLSSCENCPFLYKKTVCSLKNKEIAKINACSRSVNGRKYFRAKNGVEAYRLNILKHKKGDKK